METETLEQEVTEVPKFVSESRTLDKDSRFTDSEAKEFLKGKMAIEGLKVDPRTIVSGVIYRVNIYKVGRTDSNMGIHKMIHSHFVQILDKNEIFVWPNTVNNKYTKCF
jgi:hypothetical protein